MKTTKQFIIDAHKIHNDIYDYNRSIYTGCKNKILIGCKKHGEFNQTADDHLCGKGCKKCANEKLSMLKTINISHFLTKCKIIHGSKYDYSKVIYRHNQIKIIIICPTHGTFLQTPNNHLSGSGCPQCAGNNFKKNCGEFIDDAIKIHGDKYDYSHSRYLTAWNKITIKCNFCNKIFEQIPHIHLRGSGCPHCSTRISSEKRSSNTTEFISKAIKFHGDKFNYDRVIYKRADKKVNIVCKIHGEFSQRPNNHLIGQGCPKCKFEKCSGILSSKKEGEFLDYIKIGERSKFISGYIVDGYDPLTNTIYEFLGDYWHGNPLKYKSDNINYSVTPHTLFGALYDKTFNRFLHLKQHGYNIKYIWESEWDKFIKDNNQKLNLMHYE